MYGPASRGRLRNSATAWSSSRSNSDTWNFDSDVTPAPRPVPPADGWRSPAHRLRPPLARTPAQNEYAHPRATREVRPPPQTPDPQLDRTHPGVAPPCPIPLRRFTLSGLGCPHRAPQNHIRLRGHQTTARSSVLTIVETPHACLLCGDVAVPVGMARNSPARPPLGEVALTLSVSPPVARPV